MSVILIGSHTLLACSADGLCTMLRRYDSISDALYAIESAQPCGIVVIGVSQPDPLDWLRNVRPRAGEGWVPVAIIGSPEELPALPDPNRLLCPEISSRLRNLLRVEPRSQGNSRRLAVDVRAREVSSNGTRKSFSPAELRLLIFHVSLRFRHQAITQRCKRPTSPGGFDSVRLTFTGAT